MPYNAKPRYISHLFRISQKYCNARNAKSLLNIYNCEPLKSEQRDRLPTIGYEFPKLAIQVRFLSVAPVIPLFTSPRLYALSLCGSIFTLDSLLFRQIVLPMTWPDRFLYRR